MTAKAEQLADWCLRRLRDFNDRDPMAWFPVIGWVAEDGNPFGLATERFGVSPTDQELRLLSKALKRLHAEELIDSADCRIKASDRELTLPPLRQGVGLQFSVTSSGGIRTWYDRGGKRGYMVRLSRD